MFLILHRDVPHTAVLFNVQFITHCLFIQTRELIVSVTLLSLLYTLGLPFVLDPCECVREIEVRRWNEEKNK